MQVDSHSFARTILCRRCCDRCSGVIRFFGVRCKHCRVKCHKKCSNAISSQCENGFARVNQVTCRVGKFWRRSSLTRKWPLDSSADATSVHHSANTNQSIRPRKYTDAKGKIRQKLINGLYDSFCYSPRQALDLYPSITGRSATANVTVHREGSPSPCVSPCSRDHKDVDLPHESSRRALYSHGHEHFLPCPPSWTRTYSWSSKASAVTSYTSSSGYSSMPASCPSSANSHRSTSPTPDFSNIRSLTATLERCSLEGGMDLETEDGFMEEEDWDNTLPRYRLPATWPLKRKNGLNQWDNRRIFSVDDCQTTSVRREHVRLYSQFPPFTDKEEEEDYMKKSLKEWNIPYSDLQFGDVVGVGPKGHVYKGRWHGEIMIHTVKKSSKPDLEEFLKEVSLLSMIRHENVVLFMGACLDPPNLAFITSVRRGLSLHTHIHVRQDFFPLATRISIARQIAQGLSYLHAKGIILSRLNSMNVFLESKVKLCVTGYTGKKVVERHGYISVPRGHLTYLPPEHIRMITWSENERELIAAANDSLKTNVYVFGTVLYEIMTGRWPFSHFPVETIIWMVGTGRKQCLKHLKCPENTKSLIQECWSENPDVRPDFSKIVQFLQEQKVPPDSSHKPLTGSYSEPEKIHKVGRACKFSITGR